MPSFRPKFLPNRRQLLQGGASAIAGLTFLPRFALSEEEKKLNLYNWDTYIGETTLADFDKATGIVVKMDLYADNDELFAKLKEGNPGYDVIVPTNDFVERMIKAAMLSPIDHGKIPNMSNIEKTFQDAAFDPGRKFSIPYMWGTLGVGYRKSKADGVIDSWKPLLDSDKHAGKLSLLGDAQNVIGCTAQISRLFLQFHRSGADQAGGRSADQAEEERQGVRRRQRPGPPGLGRGRCLHGMEWRRAPGDGRG